MLNIDPLLFQPKVIRMSTTSSIGLPHGQHIIRTTEYSNSQIMTGNGGRFRYEANNNIMDPNTVDSAGEFASRGRDFGNSSGRRNVENFNEMELSNGEDQGGDMDLQSQEWPTPMYWSGEGEGSDHVALDLIAHQNSASIMSFQSNETSSNPSTSFHSQLSEQSDSSKEEIIQAMLNKVRSQSKVEASKLLLTMSNSVENCVAMRQCGCLPLLVQLLHGGADENSNPCHQAHARRTGFEVRERAGQVLRNLVLSAPDDRRGRREARVLRLLEQVRDYCDQLRSLDPDDNRNARCVDQHIGPTVATLMKLSFDEDHRHAMCQLGGLQAIAELLQTDHEVHGCTSDQYCIIIRRYSGMALTNLTFGDGANKALLCSVRPFLGALVAQLYSPSEDLRQVTASVLRNLSWRADPTCKRILRDTGVVTVLVKAAMEAEKESTLKSILSALWNLSAHCSANKADICMVDGALAFLVGTLTYKSKSRTLAIVENGGGILRNVSSHIAIQNEYRAILRKHNCLQILLQHLKSPSLTVVSNACGTLWNLSARNAADQRALWEMGAVGMLKKLINSKHKMISMGSSAALKNLLSARPPGVASGLCVYNDGFQTGSVDAPSLHIRKERALAQELDENLAETCDDTDSPKTSPSHVAVNNKMNRHVSPSARYYTTQKQKNEILNSQNAVSGGKLSYVVEEKHNGAFQVTKNAKPTPQAVQNRLQAPTKPNAQVFPAQSRSESEPRNRQVENLTVGKDYRGADRVTNVAQLSKTTQVRAHSQDPNARNQDGSGIPKPVVHDSRIPLPKSAQKTEAQSRCQSASPVPQRRSIPQRQNVPNGTNSRNSEANAVHSANSRNSEPNASHFTNSRHSEQSAPHSKQAWVHHETEQQERPNRPASKPPGRRAPAPHPRPEDQPPSPQVPHPDTFFLGGEEEVAEDKPSSGYSLEPAGAEDDDASTPVPGRCSLNIRTCTNVKLLKNHALLSNVSGNRAEGENERLFKSRNGSRDYRNFEGGKTVDFSVQGDYEIDENFSVLSRSSSVASVSSFDQQFLNDDESCASDLSRHSSGKASPCELADSPGKTAQATTYEPENENEALHAKTGCQKQMVDASDIADKINKKFAAKLSSPEPEPDESAAKVQVSDSSSTERFYSLAERKNPNLGSLKALSDEQSVSELTEDADFVTCASEFNSSSSVECETMDDLSPIGRALLEKCIRAGKQVAPVTSDRDQMRQQTVAVREGERKQMAPVPSDRGQTLAVNEGEKKPMAPVTSDRGQTRQQTLEVKESERKQMAPVMPDRGQTRQQTLEVKEGECDSHSENEEKGKEDERRAEKKRLFRILESPVDKKIEARPEEQPLMYSMKVVVDQKGNRRCEKYTEKSKSKNAPTEVAAACQLDFLMSSKKVVPESDSTGGLKRPKEVKQIEVTERKSDEANDNSGRKDPSDLIISAAELETKSQAACNGSDPVQNHAVDCESDNGGDSDESMLSSSMLCEAREIAEALLGARAGSTEDMTVSTLSCLSDIDNARPPSVLGEMGSLSMTNSLASDDGLKAAVTRECQKILGKSFSKQGSTKKSLLRELQIGRLANGDPSKGCSDSPEHSSARSTASDLLGNVNPPTVFDDLSLTASSGTLTDDLGVDAGCDSEIAGAGGRRTADDDGSVTERMNRAAAIASLCARELSNITGRNGTSAGTETQRQQEAAVTSIADVTEIGCDTIGSDTELEDDFPCDDEDVGSETLEDHTRMQREEGSFENLTLTLTDENPGFFMTAEELKALQESADLILNSLRQAEISDDDEDEDHCGMSSGDMLDDETMSLVSNESDDELPSPDGTASSRSFLYADRACDGMVALPLMNVRPSKVAAKKTSPNCGTVKRVPGTDSTSPEVEAATISGVTSATPRCFPEKGRVTLRPNDPSKIRPPTSNRHSLDLTSARADRFNHQESGRMDPESLNRQEYGMRDPESFNHREPSRVLEEDFAIDDRTFTRKKSTFPRGVAPSIQQPGSMLRSPSAQSLPSFPETGKPAATSKVAAAWRNGKSRSKSLVDPGRDNAQGRLEKSASTGSASSAEGDHFSDRSSSPHSPLNRSSTSDRLRDKEANHNAQRRPSSLALQQRQKTAGSPRHVRPPAPVQRTAQRPRADLPSPTTLTHSSSIPKLQTKAQPSLIPGRRSMIPTPAKVDFPDN